MTLADSRRKELDDPSLTADERILLRCRAATDLTLAGQYEAASESLGELWQGIGGRPPVDNLPPLVAAEVLLRCGVLTGWLGSARNVAGAQEQAKDLLSESLRGFRSQARQKKASEAQYELGQCYWRLGAHDEARVVLREALKPLTEADAELKARIHIRRSLPEISENKYYEALNILKEAEPVFESAGDELKGKWHGQKALVLIRLADVVGNVDYADRAIIEFTAAIYHNEQAGHERYCALNLNNLAMLLYKVGRHGEAHEPLGRAQTIFAKLKDPGNLAQVEETRARVLVAEGDYREANRVVGNVIQTFERSNQSALLADALALQGVVWARLGNFDSSIYVLRQAVAIARDSGALTNAGLAALTLIEEHGAERLAERELYEFYGLADELLENTQDVEDVARLRACARVVVERASGSRLHDKDFTLQRATLELEAKLIEQALAEAGGSVTRASKLLGMRYQSLTNMLKTKHKKLLRSRTPAKKRRRSIMTKAG